MTNTMTQKMQTQAPFQTLEAAAAWAIEAVDDGRLDRGELYDFLKDVLAGKAMTHWLDEDTIRHDLSANISQS